MGFGITEAVRGAIRSIDESCWSPASESGDECRDGAWVAELSQMLDLSVWPEGSRVIVRAERPHPGAQLSLFDAAEGFRHTAFITDTAAGVIPGQCAGPELTHRQHARIEDRIRRAKAAGLHNLPCRATPENNAWLECVLAAADLACWSKLICFADDPALARCEIDTFRYRILHMAARIARGGRVLRLRLDASWAWAKALAAGFGRLRTAFG